MMNIIHLELRSLRKNAIITTITLSLTVFAMLMFFPSMATDSMQQLANAKLDGINPALLEAFGLSTMPDFTIVTNYFGYVMQFVIVALVVIIMTQATALFIKEETDGTIEFLYAKPVTRNDIYVQKIVSLLLYILFILGILFVVTTLGYVLYSELSFGESVKEVGIFLGAALFISLIFASIGVMLSTIIKSSKSVMGVSMGVVFGSYIIGIMSAVVDKIDFLIWISPMEWIKAEKLMNEGIQTAEFAVGILVIVIALVMGWRQYSTKDLLV